MNENMDDLPPLGDGLYPRRAILNRDRLDQWVEDHNPHIGGTTEWYLWAAGLYNDQADAIGDWRRSSLALSTRIMIGASATVYLGIIVIMIMKAVS